ncbi:unnamed protein product [Euphydryas editha]|uniref:Uncharacterized protein n=1 Tax=Euphydryas editha TaxID=104508 RepID=A0AAU9TEI4_EUPED|nr:unnamed protein product [Euphydryas editha]
MQDIPDCLSRRYKALDKFIDDLSTFEPSPVDCSTNDPGIRLLCNFWNILKEDPDVNLSQAVQQRMCVNTRSGLFGSQHISCYMAGCCNKNEDKKQEPPSKPKTVCSKPSSDSTQKHKCRAAKSKSTSPPPADELPLNKVLCNLKEAASFEKKCQTKVNDLLETQTHLQEQIQVLEQREKEGIQLLKQADCMWSCMEETYKKKIAESMERQKDLLKQLKEVEASSTKWRKNKKDLEFQMDNINKCHQEMIEKKNQKSSDIKCIKMEIEDFKKRIESNKKDIDSVKKSFGTKKQVSDNKIANIAKEVTRLENVLKEEQNRKKLKEQEGANYIKDAREDLQKLCKVLLQKKLEKEDMRAVGDALLLEVELLKESYDQCKDKCKNKQESIEEEIKSIDKEIAEFKVKCIQCHQCTDTIDIRKFCIDCPRCVNERDCLYEADHCNPDNSLDCVCTTVKQKFLDNVFDNMYTVLERQVKSGPGKAVADAVLNCLKRSRNGKLNSETRKILQDFILTTVKKNLNLTIVGGAVKTRCEMDAETYKQLMLCLKQVKVTKPVKVDKGTESKKEPCRRWGGTSECNCPKGPKECVCTKKAPQRPNEPTSCPPIEDKEDKGETVSCPYKETAACGPDCAMHELPSTVGSEVASWKPNPCQGPTCQFKNMRAAQCVLGPESLSTYSNTKISGCEIPCKCENSSTDPYVCYKDTKQVKAEKDTICDCKTAVDPKVNENNNIVVPTEKVKIHEDNNINTGTSKNSLNDINPIIFKSFSGDLKIALNQKVVEEINKNLQQGTNVYVALRKTDNGKLVFSIHSDVSISTHDKIFLPKKSPSGNIILEAYKPIYQKSYDNLNKESHDESNLVNHKDPKLLDRKDLKNLNLSKVKGPKSESEINCRMHKVEVKGVNTKNSVTYVLKETRSGNFQVILDKEYEIYNKQVIKEYEGDNNIEYVQLLNSESGHFILNFKEDQNNDDTKNALIVKTESGSLNVLVNKFNTDLSNIRDSKASIMTANALNELLSKSISISKECNSNNSRKSQLPNMKSNSDSNLYKKDKLYSIDNKNTFHEDIELIKNNESKAIATSCNARCHDNSCNKSKCVCKNICYKSKQWFWENSVRETNKNICGISNVKQEKNFFQSNNTNEFILCKGHDDVQVLKKPPHTEKNPCGCCLNLEKISKERRLCVLNDSYPYGVNNYESISSDLLKNSNCYNKDGNIDKYNFETYNENESLINEKKDSQSNFRWDSMEYFPPQLPPFLREFTYI